MRGATSLSVLRSGVIVLGLGLFALRDGSASAATYDVVVYGGSAGGVAAAIQAARMGKSVVLIEPSARLGGMTSGGLGATDIGRKDSVGMAAYTMDSHNVQRYAVGGRVYNEGDVQVGGFPPYPISYRAIVPRESECSNLAVPVCQAASHIAYGSIRMEPVFMVLGQSAATAAALAIDSDRSLQQVDYATLRARLLADGQVLSLREP